MNVDGLQKLRTRMIPAVQAISGSYHRMIEGLYPLRLLATQPISIGLIRAQRDIPCRIRVSEDNLDWAFELSQIDRLDRRFFRFEFQIPIRIAEALQRRRGDWLEIAELKQRYLTFVDLTGVVEGEYVTLRLTLDQQWLEEYIARHRQREPGT